MSRITRNTSHITRKARRAATLFFTRLASLLLASFLVSAAALAQQSPQEVDANANAGAALNARTGGGTTTKASAVRSRRVEEYSESVGRPSREQGEPPSPLPQTPARIFGDADPATILRNARAVYIRTKSVYFKSSELENELRRHPEFHQMSLVVTRDEANADLVVEVGRKVFTTRFVYTVIDPRSQLVLMSGKVSSVGGTAADKIAGEFVRKILALRAVDPTIKVIK
ncbi:MAG TPA: hypothetical protein VEQ42_11940 [Pyrinomonadaceae bacterium]|nr:hypothetical protein [Pyrinomonadaceae bacterium]